MFIKGFQKTGGAILVGFNGNPTLSNDLFDASQSPSNVMTFHMSVEIQNLFQLGFFVVGISASESFSYNVLSNSKHNVYLCNLTFRIGKYFNDIFC